MALIDSPQNQQVKHFRSLLTKKGRQRAGLCPLEGVRLIESALDGGARIKAAYTCPELLTDDRAQALIARLKTLGAPVHALTLRAFESMCDTQNPQGIAATARVSTHQLDDLAPVDSAVYLWLHEVRDPGNLGTMLRTAAAFSVRGVVLLGECADVYSPKTVRASSGAVFLVPTVVAAWDDAQGWAREHDIYTVATAASAQTAVSEPSYPERLAVIIGSEAHGVADDILKAADLQVRIPVTDTVESLNAAVAAGIMLYEVTRAGNRDMPCSPGSGAQ